MRHEEQYFNSRPQIVIYAIDISESLNLSQQKLLTALSRKECIWKIVIDTVIDICFDLCNS